MKNQIIKFEKGQEITLENAKEFLNCFAIFEEDGEELISWLRGIDLEDGVLIDRQGFEHEKAFLAVPVYK